MPKLLTAGEIRPLLGPKDPDVEKSSPRELSALLAATGETADRQIALPRRIKIFPPTRSTVLPSNAPSFTASFSPMRQWSTTVMAARASRPAKVIASVRDKGRIATRADR